LREAYPRIHDLGAAVLTVGTAAGWQAAALMDASRGRAALPFPCVVDPDHNVYRTFGFGRVRWWQWLTPRLWRNYLRAFGRGSRQGKVTGDVGQLPGVAIVGRDRRVRYLYRARTVGDYPPVEALLEALDEGRP
jgi:hypothetical protein